jgi:hypothetical protein
MEHFDGHQDQDKSLIVVVFRAFGCTTAGLRLAPMGRLKIEFRKECWFDPG